jgi:multicomponent Na+:H+ antiporter subunit C
MPMGDLLDDVVRVLPYAVAAWILLVGCYGIATSRSFIHVVGCLSLIQSSTYLLLLMIGWKHDATAPVFADVPTDVRVVDPVVQALTLTDIVVGGAVTALLLALTIQLVKRQGSIDPEQIRSLEEDLEE